jgi:hypothetical protein
MNVFTSNTELGKTELLRGLMSLRTIALSTVLLLALSGLGVAQDRDRDDQGVSPQPQYAGQQAYQNGFLDGSNDGTTDRQSGKTFRASGTERYEHGDSGYRESFGDKDVYKRFYRQGYMDGYQRTFNGATAAVPVPPNATAPVVAVPVYVQPGYNAAQSVYQNGFQDGMRDGANDLQSGHSFRAMDTDRYKHADAGYNPSFGEKEQYKQAYRQGYAAGYQQGFKGSAAAAAYPNPAPAAVYTPAPVAVYGQPAYGTQNQAYQMGFQDGMNDGANDRQGGHDFSPQKRDRYKHADTGYNSSFGDKDQYKQAYRDGFMAGYRRGYGK